MRRFAAVLAVLALAVPGGARADASCDWAMYGRDLRNSFDASGCSAIEPLTVPTLRPSWFYPTTDSITASPAVVDGVVYVGGWDGTFSAFDATPAPGPVTPLWTYAIDDPNDVAFGRIVSSAAVTTIAGTRVVVFGGGATLYVLDAASGTHLASLCLDPRSDTQVRCKGSSADIEVESSPAVVTVGGDTWVVVGMDVHNAANVGRTGVVAARLLPSPMRLDVVWKFDPESMRAYTDEPAVAGPGTDLVADPLTHGAGTGSGCAGVWSSPVVDVARDLVAFGTSSCSRPGPTVGESMFGIRLSDGSFRWQYDPVADHAADPSRNRRQDDDDFGASPNLLPNGLVGEGRKDGTYYAVDPMTGAKAWESRAGQAGHASSNFAVGGMIGSAALGRVGERDAIFATTAISTPIDEPVAGPPSQRTFDRSLADDPGRMFSLHAIDAATGEILWRSPLSRQSYGAPVFVNGALLVPSTFDFSLKAFHADTGVLLWESPLPGAPSSTPVVAGDSVFIGVGTRETDAEYKAFPGGGPLEQAAGPHPLSPASGVMSFTLAP